jgi:hypothetical protein
MLELDKDAITDADQNFSSKLTEEERLGIIALSRKGVKTTVLAIAFGVNRRTLGKLIGTNVTDYVKEKKIASGLSANELYALYVTDGMVALVNAAAKKVKLGQL